MQIQIHHPEERQALRDQEFVRVMIEREHNEDFEEWQRLSRKPARINIDLQSIEDLEEEYDTNEYNS
jgi:uncharacterized protein HemY